MIGDEIGERAADHRPREPSASAYLAFWTLLILAVTVVTTGWSWAFWQIATILFETS